MNLSYAGDRLDALSPASIRKQDARFQDVMRRELTAMAQERGMRLLPGIAQTPSPKRPKDYLPVATIGFDGEARTGKEIIREVCKKHQVTIPELKGIRRSRQFVIARHEASYRLSKETTLTLGQIGILVGGRDHTTILHGIRKHEAKLRGEVYVMPRYGKALQS